MALLWALPAVLMAAAVLLVVMPLRLALRIATDPLRIDLRLAPFGGVLGEFGLPRRKSPAKSAKEARAPHARPARQMLRALPDFLSALAGCIRIDRLRFDLRFGTGDPALTGQFYGWLTALAQGLGGVSPVPFRLLPDFDRACLAGSAEVALRLIPLSLAGPLFRLWRAARERT